MNHTASPVILILNLSKDGAPGAALPTAALLQRLTAGFERRCTPLIRLPAPSPRARGEGSVAVVQCQAPPSFDKLRMRAVELMTPVNKTVRNEPHRKPSNPHPELVEGRGRLALPSQPPHFCNVSLPGLSAGARPSSACRHLLPVHGEKEAFISVAAIVLLPAGGEKVPAGG